MARTCFPGYITASLRPTPAISPHDDLASSTLSFRLVNLVPFPRCITHKNDVPRTHATLSHREPLPRWHMRAGHRSHGHNPDPPCASALRVSPRASAPERSTPTSWTKSEQGTGEDANAPHERRANAHVCEPSSSVRMGIQLCRRGCRRGRCTRGRCGDTSLGRTTTSRTLPRCCACCIRSLHCNFAPLVDRFEWPSGTAGNTT
ncbi:hypothetical protein OF83DRAFT_694305 [Amylostereum chailletii]|nr:hypothetical protein OF83DRAFT_694305 [Amylostereum chailletii]